MTRLRILGLAALALVVLASGALAQESSLARKEIAILRSKRPSISFAVLADLSGLHDLSSLDRYRDGLQKAGFPV